MAIGAPSVFKTEFPLAAVASSVLKTAMFEKGKEGERKRERKKIKQINWKKNHERA